jgi:hypothetical protein
MKNKKHSSAIYEEMSDQMKFSREYDMRNLVESLQSGQNQLCVIIDNCDEIIKNDEN